MLGWLNNMIGRPPQRGAAERQAPVMNANELTEYATVEEALKHAVDAGSMSDAGIAVTMTRAERLAAVAACVRVLSNAIAHLPLVLYRRDGRTRQPDRDNGLFDLLHDQPNEWLTSFQWRKLMQRDMLYRGTARSLIVRGVGDRPVELLRLHPDRVTAEQDDRTMEITYRYVRKDGRRTILQRRDVLDIWSDSDDGVSGLSPISVHRETIGDGIALRTHGSKFFANGAKPLGILQVSGKIDAESKREMRNDFKSLYAGSENAYETAVLDQGVEYKPIAITMEDAQYLDARKFNRSEIAGIFGVPPHKIGDLERSTFSNIEHQSLEFVTDSLAPWMVAWEQSIKRDLLDGDSQRYVKHNVGALLRGDAKSRNEALQIQRRNGVISANEWRELDDLNPRTDEGGDAYIVEANMRPDDGKEHPTTSSSRPANGG